MIPGSPKMYLGYGGFAHAIFNGEVFLHFTQSNSSADVDNSAFSEPYAGIGLPNFKKNWGAAFARHIQHIVGVSPKPKVIRVNATGVVAPVKNVEPFRYRGNKMLVGKSMRTLRFSIYGHLSVPLFVCASSPIPAAVFADGILNFKAVKLTFIHNIISMIYTIGTLSHREQGG